MLPRDDPDYLRHVHSTLVRHLRELGFYSSPFTDIPTQSLHATPVPSIDLATPSTPSEDLATPTIPPEDLATHSLTPNSLATPTLTSAAKSPRKRIHNISLVSAKTGYGIETLITTLLCKWKRKGWRGEMLGDGGWVRNWE